MIEIFRDSVKKIQKQGVPYYEIDTWNGLNDYLESLNLNYETQTQKFPLVFLLTETLVGEDYDHEGGFISVDCDIYIFGVAELNKRPEWRFDNEFPDLEEIRDSLIKSLEEKGLSITGISPFDRIPDDDTLLNKLNMSVNTIHLGISGEYEL